MFGNSRDILEAKKFFKIYGEESLVELINSKANRHNRDGVFWLLEMCNIDTSLQENLAIRWASINGYEDIVKILLKDSRVYDNVCICVSSDRGFVETVKLLLKDKRVDPSNDDNYSIVQAYEYGHTEIVKCC